MYSRSILACLALCCTWSVQAASVAFIARGPNSAAYQPTVNAISTAIAPLGQTVSATNLGNAGNLALDLSTLSSFEAVYIDTRRSSQASARNFLNAANRSILEQYVLAGGRLFLNVANAITGSPMDLLFGVQAHDNSGSTVGIPNGKQGLVVGDIASGSGGSTITAGTTFSSLGGNNGAINNMFAPNYLTGGSLTTLMVDNATSNRTELASLNAGAGTVWFGTLNYLQRQTPNAQAQILRQNIISSLAAAPEPGELALAALGMFGLMLAWRRQRTRIAGHAA